MTEQIKKSTTSIPRGDEEVNGLIDHLEQLAVYVSTFYSWWTDIENRLQFIRTLVVDNMEPNTINRSIMRRRLEELKSLYSSYHAKVSNIASSCSD